ncbi:MAG: hypothetical protein IJZ24_07450 [Clostridia bacterium]|nr:hypothetical protein [Clostridia bacterium]MBQ8269489.1 hypothetical protein [Clostridia bacterium]
MFFNRFLFSAKAKRKSDLFSKKTARAQRSPRERSRTQNHAKSSIVCTAAFHPFRSGLKKDKTGKIQLFGAHTRQKRNVTAHEKTAFTFEKTL